MNQTIQHSVPPFSLRRGFILAVAVILAFGSVCSSPVVAAETTIESLVRLLGSENFEERERAGKALIEVGAPALEALKLAAESPDAEVARRAKACIPEIERNHKVLTIAKRLASTSPSDRAAAARSLWEFGPGAYKAVPALMAALNDQDSRVRQRVISALGGMGSAAEVAVPEFIRILENKNEGPEIREFVASSLEDLGVHARAAVPTLLNVLATNDKLQGRALCVLGKAGRDDERVLPAILKALQHDEVYVRYMAAAALLDLRKEPSVSIPALMGFLKKHRNTKDPVVKINHARYYIASKFGVYGHDAKLAVPGLIEIVTDQDEPEDVRIGAANSLRTIGGDAKAAVPALNQLLKDDRIKITPLEFVVRAALDAIESSK